MSRITIELREHIAKKESNEKFTPIIDGLKKKLKEEVEKYLAKKMPKVEIPQHLIDEHYVKMQSIVTLEVSSSDKEIFDFMRYDSKSSNIRQTSIDTLYPVKYHSNLSAPVEGRILKVVEEIKKAHEERNAFRNDLQVVLASVKSYKQGRELLPELSKYFVEKNTGSELIPIALINNVRKQLGQNQLH